MEEHGDESLQIPRPQAHSALGGRSLISLRHESKFEDTMTMVEKYGITPGQMESFNNQEV